MVSVDPNAVSTISHPGPARLSDVSDGITVVIGRLTLPRATARRLLEMGLLPGTLVRVVRRAPLGDPIELRLRNYSLSIRREEAALIEVEPSV
jgi:Fe2+ transport system protein FeoA